MLNKEEIIVALVSRHGFSEEEANKMYDEARIIISDFKETFDNFLEKMKTLIETITERLIHEQLYEVDNKWNPVLDTRKSSQVTMNKPRFTVRKII